jgi:hypothetical protein
MMAGHRPAHEALILSRGADFVHSWTIADLDPDLDPAVVARIEFARNPATTAAVITTWTASEITARTIAFRQESAVCDALPAGLRYRLMLTVPQTGDDLDICLAVGNVHRIQ